MTSTKVIRLPQIKVACSECSLRSLCLPFGLDGEELERLDEIVKRPRPLQRSQRLYHPKDQFRSLYVVRSGSIKTYTTTSTGDQQVTGFHLPGELVGLDGVSTDEYSCTAEALETTSVCELPFFKLETLSGQIHGLQRQLHRLMSKEIIADQQLLLQLGKMSAEARVAAFLLSISARLQQRGFSATEFNLTMTRTDIGNYLGMAVETVSRQFTNFQEQAFIKASRKHIEIIDLNGIKRISGIMPCERTPQAKA
ncbi:MAG: fumarate/nitrate reduction transcriptional regulator Fnr [Gammaproteobacteria bacterium]|nr:fumarate/nitrate reduction transcriptional regulator Fnr [Gammaproteobacteria bacterium]